MGLVFAKCWQKKINKLNNNLETDFKDIEKVLISYRYFM